MAFHFNSCGVVLLIDADPLQGYGDEPGLRDPELLDCALAQPKMTLDET